MNRATIAAIASRAAAILASFALTVVVARLVGVDAAGVFFLLSASVTVLATVGRFGADTMAIKVIGAEAHTDAGRSAVSKLARLTLAASTAVTAATMAAVILGDFVGEEASLASIVFSLSAVVAQALYVFAGAVLRGLGKVALGVFAELGSAPSLAVLVLLAQVSRGPVSLDSALIVFAATSWLTAGWSVAAAHRAMGGVTPRTPGGPPPRFSFDSRTTNSLLSMMGVSVVYFALAWSPVFLLSALDSVQAVALYTAAARLANVVSLIPSIQVSYLAPRFAGLMGASDVRGLNTLAGRAAFVASALAAVPAFALVVWAAPIVDVLYGTAYAQAAPLVVVLTFAAFAVVVIGQVSQLALLGGGLEHVALLTACVAAVFWITAGAIVVSQFGALGAAITTSVVNLAFAVVLSALLRRRSLKSWAAWR